MAYPLVLSQSSLVIRAALNTPVTITVTQQGNQSGMSVFGFNSAMVSVAIAPTAGAVVGSAVVGTATLSPGYTLTITPRQYGSTNIVVSGDGHATVTLPVYIFPATSAGPSPPRILSISQARSGNFPYLVAGVIQNPVTGTNPIVAFNIYRAPSPTGPFTLTDTQPISALSVVNQLFDAAPVKGVEQFYVATAVDSTQYESGYSAVLGTSLASAVIGTGKFPPGSPALGPYPLLGSDIFLDPTSREAVIGPNGDLLTINGLYLLAQDLSIRLRTEIGELAMHPSYGFMKGKLIGRGQARPTLQALNFQADVMECLYQDPRVASVLNVSVWQYDAYSWVISYVVMAIGVEDPLQANMVLGFWTPMAA